VEEVMAKKKVKMSVKDLESQIIETWVPIVEFMSLEIDPDLGLHTGANVLVELQQNDITRDIRVVRVVEAE